jgi:hypothetical protein
MDFQDVICRRRMVRQFTADPVPRRSLDRILANSVRGRSAGFCQDQAARNGMVCISLLAPVMRSRIAGNRRSACPALSITSRRDHPQ